MIRSLVLTTLLLASGAACSDPPAPAREAAPARLVIEAPSDPSGVADFVVDFGRIGAGTQVVVRLAIRNGGGRAASVRTDPLAAPFAWTQGDARLAPGAEGELALRFAPVDAGAFQTVATLRTGNEVIHLRLSGSAEALPVEGCSLSPETRPVRWTGVATGATADRTLRLANDGDAPCRITLEVEGPGFSLPQAEQLVPAGAFVPVALSWTATAGAPVDGTLTIRAGEETWTVALQGVPMTDCLQPSPPIVDFGVAGICAYAAMPVVVTNACAWPVELAGWERNGAGFEVEDDPGRHRWLGPGESASFWVQTQPGSEGAASAEVVFHDGSGASAAIELRADYQPVYPQTDRYESTRVPRVDVLLVVDDGPAMQPYRDRVDAYVRGLLLAMRERPVYARLGLTTTSLLATDGCADSGAGGNLLPTGDDGALWLDPAGADALDRWTAALARLGSCSTAPNEGIAAAWHAVSGEDERSAGFLRPEASLSILFASASDDASGETIETWKDRFLSLKGPRNANQLALHALAPGCGDDPLSSRYGALARATGGEVGDVCTDEWFSPHWGSYDPWPARTSFPLASWPHDADHDGAWDDDIVVRIDGVALPAEAEDGTRHWSYAPATNAVVFAPGYAPFDGASLEIDYAVSCFGRG